MIFLFVFLLVLLPLFAGNYWLAVASLVGYTILSAMGVQLLIGYCGQVTLGHSAFIAVGAYTSAILMLQYQTPYLLSLVAAGLVAGVWSVLFGLPSARVKGFYLIMTTMITVGPWAIDNDLKVYYLMVALVALCTLGLSNLMRTKIGRAWIAIRDNDIAAETMGVNIVAYKLLAFFVAGVLGGIAGAFWVSSLAALSPEHFQWGWSLWIVGVILIGGVGSTHGTIFGALFMTLILEGLKFAVIPLSEDFPQLQEKFLFIKESTFGLAICLFLLFEPKGLAYRWWQIKNYFNLWPFSY
jgi:branched-chain amino acid transport system permease protein